MMKLSTRIHLLLYALILSVFLLFLPSLRSMIETRAPLKEVEGDLEDVLLLRRLDYLVARETFELLDVLVAADYPQEFSAQSDDLMEIRDSAQQTLTTLTSRVAEEDDEELAEVERLAHLQDVISHLDAKGMNLLQQVQRGQGGPDFEELRTLMRLRREEVSPAIDDLVLREAQAIDESLDRLLAASGHFAFLPMLDISDAVSGLRRDTAEMMASATFALNVERLAGEYIDVALLEDPPRHLYAVRIQTDEALRLWRMHIEALGPGQRAEFEENFYELSRRYEELNGLGEEMLRLAEEGDDPPGNPAVFEFLVTKFEPIAEETLRGLIAVAYSAEERQTLGRLAEAEKQFLRAGYLATGLALILFLLVLSSPWLLSRWIVQPITALNETTKKFEAGDFSQRVDLKNSDELGELAAGMNRMAAGLEEARERIRRQDRLAVLGELAGSVAHEIRNPLGIIKNSSYYLQATQKGLSAKGNEHLAIIEQQSQRANRIISEMLAYGRDPQMEKSRFQLQEATQEALAVVDVPSSVEVIWRFVEPSPWVEADRNQIVRCLVNLVSNAVQAMNQGGTLRIECERRGEKAVVVVRDSGPGIAEDRLEAIFEPLVTSKRHGIGLGLPVSQRYARLNGGQLECESELGCGSTFRLTLPLWRGHG